MILNLSWEKTKHNTGKQPKLCCITGNFKVKLVMLGCTSRHVMLEKGPMEPPQPIQFNVLNSSWVWTPRPMQFFKLGIIMDHYVSLCIIHVRTES